MLNFELNCLIVLSWITLISWGLTTALMADGILIKPELWSFFTLALIPLSLVILLIWSYRTMVLHKTPFLPMGDKE